jgi:hypothetical protein
MSPQVAAGYGGLRNFVWQTLARNLLLYLFCFAGMLLTLLRFHQVEQRTRIALIFTVVITALVFTHDQPWPYVFIMALPFVALWAPMPLELFADQKRHLAIASAVLALAVGMSFVRNLNYLSLDNRAQLALVDRAEKLVSPDDIYFDGVGMLPNRDEPSLLWLDRQSVVRTLQEGPQSEAYRIIAGSRPTVILWSYRMGAIAPVVGSALQNSYVQVAPNLRMLGRKLDRQETVRFDVPRTATYALFNEAGNQLSGRVSVNGQTLSAPVRLERGIATVTLEDGPGTALLLPEGRYAGLLSRGSDDDQLFANVYD